VNLKFETGQQIVTIQRFDRAWKQAALRETANQGRHILPPPRSEAEAMELR
jgi:hypothetical protein